MTKYIVIWIMTSTIQAPCDYDVTTASMAGLMMIKKVEGVNCLEIIQKPNERSFDQYHTAQIFYDSLLRHQRKHSEVVGIHDVALKQKTQNP
ncbi:MAG: hypothetical protein WBN18_15890 [Flavobacteriaceae bacterium]